MAIRYIPKKLAGSEWTCLSERCLHILCIEGNLLIVLKNYYCFSKDLILFDSLVCLTYLVSLFVIKVIVK